MGRKAEGQNGRRVIESCERCEREDGGSIDGERNTPIPKIPYSTTMNMIISHYSPALPLSPFPFFFFHLYVVLAGGEGDRVRKERERGGGVMIFQTYLRYLTIY